MFNLKSSHTLYCDYATSGISLAINNLKRDFSRIAGSRLEEVKSGNAEISITADSSFKNHEQYKITISEDRITIAGGGELGIIFGIYKLSEVALHVDPYWFWKDNLPPANSVSKIPEQVVTSPPYTFKYRGWFINDEDLLSDWQTPGGKRLIDYYAYYKNVIAPDLVDLICETALRAGTNLIIPATFVDIMNPPERKLIERAVANGLYVSQHHVEPLGVSHFTFEIYWKNKGDNCVFSYKTDKDKVLAIWKDYVRQWHEVAGDKVIWQLGLRGKGDSSAWYSDSSITRESAGEIISDAIQDQVNIIKAVDSRKVPIMTLTLWHEMSELMVEDALTIPDSIIQVFCDSGKKHLLQDDFYQVKRQPATDYGVYLHTAYWIKGPHAIPGVHPERLQNNFNEAAIHGDTEYAIISVANIREQIIDIQAANELMCNLKNWRLPDFFTRYGEEFADEYYRYFEAFCNTKDGTIHDGELWLLVKGINKALHQRNFDIVNTSLAECKLDTACKRQNFILLLQGKIKILESILLRRNPPGNNGFHEIHLFYFSEWLFRIYCVLIASLEAFDHPEKVSKVAVLLDQFLEFRSAAEQGKWKNWYRGDRKTDWRAIRENLRSEGGAWQEWYSEPSSKIIEKVI
jgi:hypothetical protein